MKEILFVPGLKKNLLSISALDAKGMRVAFIDGQVIMWPKGKKIDDAVVIGEQGGLYKLKGHLEQSLIHDTVEPNELYHRRLAHVHYRELPIAFQTKHAGVCKGCAKGKNTKKTFPSSESKSKGILEIIHFDVCGPMSSNSLSGYAYHVSFIDDFSRKTWIYFMKNKNEVFSKLKEFKALIEKPH